MDYVKASFMFDYRIDLDKNKDMHWWTFSNLLNGLSNSEFGDCCILNRIRNIRNTDLNEIKDKKERDKLAKLKKQFAIKKEEEKLTEEQEESMKEFNKILGL